MRFSAGEAAFEGFRVTRHHPLALLVWAGISLIGLIVIGLVAMPLVQPIVGEMQTILTGGGGGEMSADAQMRIRYATYLTAPISLVIQAVLMSALYRAMTSPGRDRYGFVRFGRDELRLLGVLVFIFLVSTVISEGFELATTLVRASAGQFPALLVSSVGLVIAISVSVRLVLAAPAAFSEHRINIRGAWDLTATVFWPLMGVAIIAGLMAGVVIFLLAIIALPIYGGLAATGSAAPIGGVAALAGLILVALGMTMVMTIVSAPFMAAYLELTGKRDASPPPAA